MWPLCSRAFTLGTAQRGRTHRTEDYRRLEGAPRDELAATLHPLFAGVTLPPRAASGQAQIIVTKTLVIYGTGRLGGVPNSTPQLFAVYKATGRQVGTKG